MGFGGSFRRYNKKSTGFWGIFNRTDISKKVFHVFDYGVVRVKIKNGPGYLFISKYIEPYRGAYSQSKPVNKNLKYCWIFSGESEIDKQEIIKHGSKVDESGLIEELEKTAQEQVINLVLFNIDSVSEI